MNVTADVTDLGTYGKSLLDGGPVKEGNLLCKSYAIVVGTTIVSSVYSPFSDRVGLLLYNKCS